MHSCASVVVPQLQSVPATLLPNVRRLEVLDLSYNSISALPDDINTLQWVLRAGEGTHTRARHTSVPGWPTAL